MAKRIKHDLFRGPITRAVAPGQARGGQSQNTSQVSPARSRSVAHGKGPLPKGIDLRKSWVSQVIGPKPVGRPED